MQFILTIWLLALTTSSFAQFGGGGMGAGMGAGMGRRGGMGQNHSDTSSNASNSIANSINPIPAQLTQEL